MNDNYYERYWSEDHTGSPGVAVSPPHFNEADWVWMMRYVEGFLKGDVLDAGCGNGAISERISRLPDVFSVTGVDVSKTAISLAKDRYPVLRFLQGSVTDLPFPDKMFDAVCAAEVVEHIYDVESMFNEFSRVLKKGGALFLTTTDFNLLKRILVASFFWNRYFYPTNPHIRFFTRKTLEAMLSTSGLLPEMYRWHGSYMGLMPKGQIVVAVKPE